jgi:hypothetical protein
VANEEQNEQRMHERVAKLESTSESLGSRLGRIESCLEEIKRAVGGIGKIDIKTILGTLFGMIPIVSLILYVASAHTSQVLLPIQQMIETNTLRMDLLRQDFSVHTQQRAHGESALIQQRLQDKVDKMTEQLEEIRKEQKAKR